MKTLLLSLLFATAFLTAKAGPNDTVSFKVSPQTAAYVVENVQDVEIQTAIAVAIGNVRDSAARPKIVITEQQVITILNATTRLPEGVAAEPNKLLLYALYPYMLTRPWLAQNASRVLAQNAATLESMAGQGFQIMERINASIRRN